MPRRMKKVKKNVAPETNQPKLQKKGTEEFEFDIGSLSLADLLRLTEGYVDDESEETVLMTRREMNLYIKNKMEEHSKDPNINPFINLEKQARMLLKEVKLKEQQLMEAKEDYEVMYRDQLKFFRHIGIVPKVPTKSVGVSADFPVLPESLPPPEFLVKGQFYFVDLPSCKILKPSTSRNSASLQRTNTEESKPKTIKPSTSRNSASKQRTNTEESKPKIIKPSKSRNSASKQRSNTKESKPKIKVECFDVPSD
ncbi:uncharacterized protein TNCT_486371 [Trichonephila clavata]|uniref:Uncharacterized protein n=1 Tax=Trichonephila clavata TaxID=2740835 RepID=A0A8X6IE21_TRICU|nr:uncharacterized protein TNCT_486371 [Trichonephila clavata]